MKEQHLHRRSVFTGTGNCATKTKKPPTKNTTKPRKPSRKTTKKGKSVGKELVEGTPKKRGATTTSGHVLEAVQFKMSVWNSCHTEFIGLSY